MSKSKLNTYHRYLPQIVETMHDGLAIIDTDGHIVMVNRALEKITGYTRKEILGRRCTLFQCDACEVIRKSGRGQWCRLFDGPQTKREHIRCDIIRKDGMIIPVLKNAVLLKDDQGEIIGAVETLIDLSEIEKRDRKIEELSRRLPSHERFCGMVGQSAPMHRVYALIEKAARSLAPVIISGESGTGKELAAQAIHQLSERRDEPFIQLNCAALNESLLESELFGHVKGAFTGAYRHRTGRFEAAGRGAIFLDEIGEMPMTTQTKLLRVVENKRVERVGDHTPITVDVRIISATNKHLTDMVRSGTFREDLFFRISVIPIEMPPLRDRLDDLPLLTDALIRELTAHSGKPVTGISKAAMDHLLSYAWPGNVRELKSALEFAFAVAEAGILRPEHLPRNITARHQAPPKGTLPASGMAADNGEKADLIAALKAAGGNRSETARILGVTRATVWNRIRKYGIKVEQIIQVQ
ncbi:MAG: sigma 54-interacting transcriptional regulator [Desulfatitalea sp.]|nr:sigma 54-interacting transcriptional regulator [Desulfatitalea sp.]